MLKIILLILCISLSFKTKEECIVLGKKFSHIIHIKDGIYYTVEDLYDFKLLDR